VARQSDVVVPGVGRIVHGPPWVVVYDDGRTESYPHRYLAVEALRKEQEQEQSE
jgi:hypothetical protein